MKKSSIAIALLFSASMFVGCGSSSSSSDDSNSSYETPEVGYNGIFVDAAVAGVTWNCGTASGTTDTAGHFGECPAGESVTFSVGNVELGTVVPTEDNIFTPQDVVGVSRDNVENEEVNKIASLLLSLDADGDSTNGISIDDATLVEFNKVVEPGTKIVEVTQEKVTEAVSVTIEAVVENNPESPMEVVSPEEAASHLVDTKELIDNGEIVGPIQPVNPIEPIPENPIEDGPTTGSTGGN